MSSDAAAVARPSGPIAILRRYTGLFRVQLAISAFAYRLTRARQMARQYPWLYQRKGLLGWEERH